MSVFQSGHIEILKMKRVLQKEKTQPAFNKLFVSVTEGQSVQFSLITSIFSFTTFVLIEEGQ